MYQALYRKWRSRTVDQVVGQEHVTQTLKRQVETGRLSHAYLFTGTRGTGKTSCAKLLARAVNCEHPVNGNPCNQCPACLGIENGSILDVLELDAASNNGVDQVRALRDEAVFRQFITTVHETDFAFPINQHLCGHHISEFLHDKILRVVVKIAHRAWT